MIGNFFASTRLINLSERFIIADLPETLTYWTINYAGIHPAY